MAWLYSLHDYNRKVLGNDGYFARCRDDPGGRVFCALVYARAFVAHDLMDLTLRWQGTRGRGVRWIDRGRWRLPPDPDKYGRDSLYDDLVVGQPLSDPLRTAQAFVASLS